MKGRPRKPTALKILHGDYAKNPQNRNASEPLPEVEKPKCPTWLKGEGRKEFGRITDELFSLGVLAKVDRGMIESYCETYRLWRETLKDAASEPFVFQTVTGPKENPIHRVARNYADQLVKGLIQMGLTPIARSRLNVKEQTPAPRMRRVR